MPNYLQGENRHNALGFRGDDVSPIKPENVFRIGAVGGSTTYSSDVEDYRHSYPFQLGAYLHEQGFDQIEVVNAGVGGYTSHQTLINLQLRVLPVQPDLVIFYQGYNDIHSRLVYPFSKYQGDNSGYVVPRISPVIMPSFWEYSTALRAMGIHLGLTKPHSAIDLYYYSPASTSYWEDFTRQWRRGEYPSGIFVEVSAIEMLENNPPIHFERNVENMLATVSSQGADALLVTFITSTEFDVARVASEEYILALRQHNEVTRKIAASTETPIFDLASIFPDDPKLFTDGRHMTLEGNQIRAKLIGDFVIREFLS